MITIPESYALYIDFAVIAFYIVLMIIGVRRGFLVTLVNVLAVLGSLFIAWRLYPVMHQCLGPCQYEVDPAVYEEISQKIISFLNGNTKEVEQELKARMQEASDRLAFEQAKEYADYLEAIRHIKDRQFIEVEQQGSMAVYDEGFQEASRQSAVLMKKHMLGGILKLIGSYLLLGLYMLGLYLGLLAAFFFGVKWLDPSSASMMGDRGILDHVDQIRKRRKAQN